MSTVNLTRTLSLALSPIITLALANEYDAVRAENARKLMEERQKRVKGRRELLKVPLL